MDGNCHLLFQIPFEFIGKLEIVAKVSPERKKGEKGLLTRRPLTPTNLNAMQSFFFWMCEGNSFTTQSNLTKGTLPESWGGIGKIIGLLLIVQSNFRVPSPGLSVEIKTWRKMRPVQANANSDIETPQANSLKGYTKR